MSVSGLVVELRQETPIALDAAFACAPGEVLALVGPSGSGKSTILRSIAGSYRPHGGRVVAGGGVWFDAAAHVFVPPHRRAVGMVFQSYALFPHMTALGNVMAAMGHVPSERRAARAREILDLVHLAGLERRRPAELSGGERQRVAVARALAREPRVLLLDEPFSAVDKVTRQRLYREIAELRRVLEMPVVLVTHDLDEAAMLADRMAVLERGRILQTGTPEEIVTAPRTVEVARLVDLRNLFDATVVGHTGERTVVSWAGLAVAARRRPELEVDSGVICIVPEGYVALAEELESPGAPDAAGLGADNRVRCTIGAVRTVGQSVLLTLHAEHAPEPPISCSVPLHVAHARALAPGARATVHLPPEGIHLLAQPSTPNGG